ncbi:MAG TPA: DUF4881 domain-containing protein [Dissulfurispiraceae bacterium]|nr:DUF4881 domain-containing protein [Dissulfurispiraceae bacterium]
MKKGFRFLKKLCLIALPAILFIAFVSGCGELGQVDQGRVIEYDKAMNTVTLIQDKKADPGNPDYNTLPPHTYVLPTDPMEMGAAPKAGYRMRIDIAKNQITVFDPATQGFKVIDFALVDKKENIDRENELVKGKKFPQVNKEKKTVTIYSARLKQLIVFSPPYEYLALPEKTWDAGDEVRIYFKEPGKALRFMNITRTDIFKK